MTKEYREALDLSYVIYQEIYGEPKSHKEYAEGFNIRGRLARTILQYEQTRQDGKSVDD